MNRHRGSLAVDLDLAEILATGHRRLIDDACLGRLDEFHFGAEGPVEFIRTKTARVQRPAHKLPEGLEVLEAGAVRMVVMGRGVMHVRRQPHGIADMPALDEGQEPGNLELPTAGCAVIAIGHGFPAVAALRILAVAHLQADRHVACNHLPDRAAVAQAIAQPGKLRFAKIG